MCHPRIVSGLPLALLLKLSEDAPAHTQNQVYFFEIPVSCFGDRWTQEHKPDSNACSASLHSPHGFSASTAQIPAHVYSPLAAFSLQSSFLFLKQVSYISNRSSRHHQTSSNKQEALSPPSLGSGNKRAHNDILPTK